MSDHVDETKDAKSDDATPEEEGPKLKFLGSIEDVVEEHPTPLEDDSVWFVSLDGNNGDHENTSKIQVFLHQQVYTETLDYARENIDREIGGILLGKHYRHQASGREFVDVQVFLPAKHAQERAASFTFTVDSMQGLYEEKDQHYGDLKILGWFHSHPGFGIFLSSMDLFIHHQFFPRQWQIAYVVDPRSLRVGCFHQETDNAKAVITCEDLYLYSPRDGAGMPVPAGFRKITSPRFFRDSVEPLFRELEKTLREEFDALHEPPPPPPTPWERMLAPASNVAVLGGGALIVMLVAISFLGPLGRVQEAVREVIAGVGEIREQREEIGEDLRRQQMTASRTLKGQEGLRGEVVLARERMLRSVEDLESRLDTMEGRLNQAILPAVEEQRGVYLRLRPGDDLSELCQWYYGDACDGEFMSYLAAINRLDADAPTDRLVFFPELGGQR